MMDKYELAADFWRWFSEVPMPDGHDSIGYGDLTKGQKSAYTKKFNALLALCAGRDEAYKLIEAASMDGWEE